MERNRVIAVGETHSTGFVKPHHPPSFMRFKTQGTICLFIAMCHHIHTENAIYIVLRSNRAGSSIVIDTVQEITLQYRLY